MPAVAANEHDVRILPVQTSMQAKPPATTPLDALHQPSVLIWTVLAGEGLAVVLALAPGVSGDRLIHFGLASLAIQWVMLSTLASLYLIRAPLSRLPQKTMLYIALLLLLLMTLLVHGLAGWLMAGPGDAPSSQWSPTLLRAAGIALTVGLLGLAAFQNHLRAQQLAVQAKHAELESLKARTHPHFLFNTLNTGAALIHAKPEAAEHLLLDLADLFRAALTGPEHIKLASEIDLVHRYLSIEQLRLGDRLRTRWERPDPLPDITVPALCVQPLVENAVRHGVERIVEGGDIEILITVDADNVMITIRNDVPSAGSPRQTSGHGIGMASVSHRIAELTAGAGSLTTGQQAGRHVATLTIPLHR